MYIYVYIEMHVKTALNRLARSLGALGMSAKQYCASRDVDYGTEPSNFGSEHLTKLPSWGPCAVLRSQDHNMWQIHHVYRTGFACVRS